MLISFTCSRFAPTKVDHWNLSKDVAPRSSPMGLLVGLPLDDADPTAEGEADKFARGCEHVATAAAETFGDDDVYVDEPMQDSLFACLPVPLGGYCAILQLYCCTQHAGLFCYSGAGLGFRFSAFR